MRLSIGIMMGRHTIENPVGGILDACAIPMALNSVGRKLLGAPDRGITIFEAELYPGNDYSQIVEEWPWLIGFKTQCKWCDDGCILYGTQIIFHPFDTHVMRNGTITLEQMCDWIHSIEPAEPEESAASELIPREEAVTA